MWALSPLSASSNLTDCYYYNDPIASGLQIVTAVLGSNGAAGASAARSASFDVRSLSATNPALPQNVVLPSVPAISNPIFGSVNQGLTPTFSWSAVLTGVPGFYELALDQVDGSVVRGWRLILASGTTVVSLPALSATGFASLKFQQGANFGSANQIRAMLSAVRTAPGFDFNNASLDAVYASDHQIGRVVFGYAP